MTRNQAIAYFVGMGWTPAQSAGIVANLVAESDLNPTAVGDSGQSYGLAQWHPDRQAAFAALMGKSIHGSSVEDQVAFVHAELNGTEKAAGDALRACTTASGAGACVSTEYERPADKAGEAAKRGALAEQLLATYQTAQDQAGATISAAPVSVPVQTPSEAPMPFVALLGTLLPMITQLFQPKIAEPLAKITGQSADAVGPMLTDLFTKIGQALGVVAAGQQVTTASQAVQVTAAAQNATPDQVSAMEQAAAEMLDKVGPMVDKIGELDAATNAARIAGTNAAAARNANPEGRRLQMWLAVCLCAIVSIVDISFLVLLGLQMWNGGAWKDPNVGLVGLMGPLLMATFAAFKDLNSYAWDGSPAANAANAANAAIAAALPKPPQGT